MTNEDGVNVEPTTLTISAESLADAGLESQVQSWIGEGPNESITADQIAAIVGEDQLAQAAESLGKTPDDLAADLAAKLPGLVDAANAQGQTLELQGQLRGFAIIAPASDLTLIDELPIDGHATLQLKYL
ncbi:YidB family protein [Streptomyces sp. NPDC057963]|uniref:YidB family protein n=1 Tax=Streptomyces sp. NPDC057963 TaxID=3346290 RepID=UPI0036EBF7E3